MFGNPGKRGIDRYTCSSSISVGNKGNEVAKAELQSSIGATTSGGNQSCSTAGTCENSANATTSAGCGRTIAKHIPIREERRFRGCEVPHVTLG